LVEWWFKELGDYCGLMLMWWVVVCLEGKIFYEMLCLFKLGWYFGSIVLEMVEGLVLVFDVLF